jgi:antitoxin component YwqK of YwqJK toxin-antitoxin module
LNGNLHGSGVRIWRNGKTLSRIGAYEHGIEVGQWREYHLNGKLRCTWHAGIEDPPEHHHKQSAQDNGQLCYVGQAKNSGATRCGHGSNLGRDGRLYYSGTWLDGKIHCDSGVIFHNTGHVSAIGARDMGKRQGYTIIFTETGKLYHAGVYHNDMRDGFGQAYHYATTGGLKYEGTWKNDKFHGIDNKEYYENGNLKYHGNFHNGHKHRDGKEFDMDGQLVGDVKHFFGEVCTWNPNQIVGGGARGCRCRICLTVELNKADVRFMMARVEITLAKIEKQEEYREALEERREENEREDSFLNDGWGDI